MNSSLSRKRDCTSHIEGRRKRGNHTQCFAPAGRSVSGGMFLRMFPVERAIRKYS